MSPHASDLAVTPPSSCSENGGDERIRTDDPLLAKQVLYQLSYTPTVFPGGRPLPRFEAPLSGTFKTT